MNELPWQWLRATGEHDDVGTDRQGTGRFLGDREQERGRVVNDIQMARDVLAKYRSYAGTAQDWALRGGTSRLIRIAADPDLLDAIDAFLAFEEKSDRVYGMVPNNFATSLAAAIIAADERMSS